MKRFISVFLILALLAGLCAVSASAASMTADSAMTDAAAYLVGAVPKPGDAGADGDRTALALARSGCSVPDGWFESCYSAIVTRIISVGDASGTTDYAACERAALALTAIGRDPRDVGGRNLLLPLGDYDKTVSAGLGGVCYALLALDAGKYAVPVNSAAARQATRELYVAYILNRQGKDGGWAAGGEKSDPAATAVALQALAPYRGNAAVESAVTVALDCLSGLQNVDGTYSEADAASSEPLSQVLLALTALGVSAADSRFVKGGHTALDALLTFRAPNGAFRRTAETDLAATAQALSALAAVRRAESGKVSFYDMSDVTAASDAAGKPSDAVKPLTVTKPGTTFTDIRGHENQKAIETLASCGVIGGMGGGLFAPDASMTRAQFAKIVVSALGLTPEYRATFRDTPKSAWFSPCVDTAAAYGIVKGVGAGKFNPNGTITRQDAAVMVARAAKLCGLDTAVDADAVRGALCGYSDYAAVSDYAAGSLAFCCRAGILTGTGSRIDPLRPVLRGEIAQMLCNMLIQAGLLK